MLSQFRLCLLALLLLAIAAGLTLASGWSKARLRDSMGLAGTIYQGTGFSGPPVFQGATDTVDLSVLDEHPGLSRQFFSLVFAGTWMVPSPGPVQIYAGGNDIVRVFIDDDLIIERNRALGFKTKAATTTFSAGPHRMRVEYVQYGGGASLKVLWAPPGQAPRPIPPESLFVSVPSAEVMSRVRLAAHLGTLSNWAWIVFAAVALSLLVFSVGRTGRRLLASRVPQVLTRRAIDTVVRWQARYGQTSFWLASGAAILWAAGGRMPALNPQTLWSDDVAVACVTKLDSLWAAVTVPAPLAPGFVALLWIARRTIADPEVSLQVLPLAFGLVGPLLVGMVVSRLTSSYMLGFIAVVLGLGTANLAQYSVFVKPYSLDYALTALFLLLAQFLFVDRREVRLAVAGAGLVAVLFSMPSVFLSLALVHVAALAPGPISPSRPPSRWLRWATVAGFDLLLVVVYFVVLRSRSNPVLRVRWINSFAPATSLADLVGFLHKTGWTAIREALPEPLMALAPLMIIGLAALVISPSRRWFGLFVALVYAGVIAASMLQIYPIGTGAKARVSIYAYAMTMGLVVVGFDALTRWWMPLRALARGAAAIVVVLCVARLTPPAYPRLDQAQIARELESSVTPADAIVLNTFGARLAGYYASWPISLYPDGSAYGFAVRIGRPRTLTLPRTAEEGGSGLDVMEDFLAREHPPRVFLFSTRRGTDAAENAIRARGFEEVRRKSGKVSARLIEYRRIGSQ